MQKKIINSSKLTQDDIVLEIGAGKGDFTVLLAQQARRVYALEIDERLYNELERNLKSYHNCQILKYDILKFNIHEFLQSEKIEQKIKVVGNIPYYISSAIIEHLINYRSNISEAFITVQKEFAQRVSSVPGSKEYGSFSCFTQYYAQCKILFEINRLCFHPTPKVDSAFLALKFRDQPPVQVTDENDFFKLIRKAFNQRRKTLRNSLKDLVDSQILENYFIQEKINPNIRPEDLSLEQFANLLKKIEKIS
ncbi:MAG: 16S rRNA (adenine(1518)-N(6)/adenine(1519)-N(6))-dimethyltransferase RsmA [Candidatus Omnitrophota bacterium]